MLKRLPHSDKVLIVKKALLGANKSEICKQYQISRTILYKWIKAYTSASKRSKSLSLSSKIRHGKSHHNSLKSATVRKIRNIALKNPSFSVQKIAEMAGVSIYGAWKVLNRLGLSTQEERNQYILRNGKSLIKSLPVNYKVTMIRRFADGEKIASICRDFGVSRTAFYKFHKKFEEGGKQREALESARASGENHWRYVPGIREEILNIVAQHPEYSAHNIESVLTRRAGKKVFSDYSIYMFLKNRNLNTYQRRLSYAQSNLPVSARAAAPIISFEKPPIESIPSVSPNAPPSFVSRLLPLKVLSPFLITFFAALTTYIIASTLFDTSGAASKIGMVFAFTSLFFGALFFLYSIKYYLTIAIVLSFSRQDSQSRVKGFFSRFSKVKRPGVGLNPNLDNIVLERKPFVSIHLATFNEKRVIDRLLTAATSIDYENYEVIVADDSTDETYDIIKKWVKHSKIKISHRDDRTGYKGGALREALKMTDPRAEFIMVFDADFIPFPDVINQFLKFFQESCGGLSGDNLKNSNIAAVQGYQWHVLNKSENWITRGVRSEYAGSYVLERSAEEIYGGLKQISGSVYAIRRDVLEATGWGTSITEDFQLTLRLYERGFKVVYTPYIQAPAEAVLTVRRLIKQRMRWAEGHSFNVKKMFRRLMSPQSPLSNSEKFEFLYLAPYYLQAAFFIVGTLAWFIAELVFRVRLPFWTEMWGWSLILTNLFALPLMNLVGLFLEEAEEKDYTGLASFVVLSYIVAPFQAYAAMRGFLLKEEGPWFRTPKTGRITDEISRLKIGFWWKKLFPWANPAQPSVQSVGFASGRSLALLRVVSDNGLFPFRRKRPKWVRSVIAIIVLSAMSLNYLAIFVSPAKAAGTRKFEQQINIVDEEASAGTAPAGIVCVDTSVYSDATYYFEVVATNTAGADQTVTFSKGGNGGSPACGSGTADTSTTITITASTTTATRFRTSSIASFPTGEVFVSSVGANVAVRAARVIILQSSTTTITKTQTQIELGNKDTETATGYTIVDNKKIFCFDSRSTGTTCAAASPTLWSPAPTVYFEATISNSNAGSTAYAILSSTPCTVNVSGSEVTTTSASYTRVRSGSITLTAGTNYTVCIKASANTANIANAKIILEQSDPTNGVTKLETTQVYNNTVKYDTDTTYTRQNFDNLFDPANFSTGSFGFFVESTMYNNGGALGYVKVKDETTPADITGGEINTSSATAVRVRAGTALSGLPSSSKNFDVEIKGNTGGNYTYSYVTWLLVQINIGSNIEQQINMIDQEKTTTSTTLDPTDNALGMIRWDNDKFSNISSITFEALICNTGWDLGKGGSGPRTTTATLYNVTDGAEIASATLEQGPGCTYTLATTDVTTALTQTSPTNNDDDDLTVRIKTNNSDGTAKIKAARIKVVQSSSGMISDTQAQIEVGNNQAGFTTSYANLTDYKIYQFNNSVFTPSPGTSPGDVEFHATFRVANSTSDTAYVELYNKTDSTSVAVLSSTGSTSFFLKIATNVDGDADWDTTNDDEYIVRVKCDDNDGGGCAGVIANAKIVLNQSDSTNGVTDLETVQEYPTFNSLGASSVYSSLAFYNTFNPANFTGTKTYYFEADLKTSNGSYSAYAQLWNSPDSLAITGSEVSTTSTSYVRQRSGDITSNVPGSSKTMDTQLKSGNVAAYAYASNSWLIIQISSLPIPEMLAWAIPLAIFFPTIVKWFRTGRFEPTLGFNLAPSFAKAEDQTFRERLRRKRTEDMDKWHYG